jgi:hypothetical protein
MEDLRKARRIAHAFRFICPSYYIPGEQDWGRFDCKEVQTSLQAFQHASALQPPLVSTPHAAAFQPVSQGFRVRKLNS